MPNAFNFSASPFDCLTPDEQSLVRHSAEAGLAGLAFIKLR